VFCQLGTEFLNIIGTNVSFQAVPWLRQPSCSPGRCKGTLWLTSGTGKSYPLHQYCHVEGQSGEVWRLSNKSDDFSEIGKHDLGKAAATFIVLDRKTFNRETGATPCDAADGTPPCFRRTSFKDASLEAQIYVT
jgi:hypothetical protein